MSTERVLLFGGSGMLGQEIHKRFQVRGMQGSLNSSCDITFLDDLRRSIKDLQPTAVINCAAYTDVDKAEVDLNAHVVNAIGAELVAVACLEAKVHLTHISTDYVFGGDKGTICNIEDVPRPLSEYGRSKLDGENRIRHLVEKHSLQAAIVRTSWLFGRFRASFPEAILMKALSSNGEIPVVKDQVSRPTLAWDLARKLELVSSNKNVGIFQLSGRGICSRFDLAKELIYEAYRVTELPQFDRSRVIPVITEILPGKAIRPSFSAMRVSKISEDSRDDMLSWQDAVKLHVRHLKQGGFFTQSLEQQNGL